MKRNYVVFSVGDKLKDLSQFITFRQHMLREIKCPCDLSKTHLNKVLIGDIDVKEDFLNYTKDVHFKKNNPWARDLLLSLSHEYILKMNDKDKEDWINLNVKFLKDNFGDNCRFAIVHLDENQPLHIHALIVPKFLDNKGTEILSMSRYFNGREKLSEWQTKYYECMKERFKDLERGIVKSNAKAIDIHTVYGIVSGEVDPNDSSKDELLRANKILKVRIEQLESQVEKLSNKLNIKSERIELDVKFKNSMLK